MSPIQSVVKELKKRNVMLDNFDALEIFGYTGEFHTIDYISEVATIEVWEIRKECEEILKKNLPTAKIKITDSFWEIKSTSRKYDLIVVDNPMSTYNTHCEHFELFPDIFRVAKDSFCLILNVIPEIDNRALRKYPYLFNEQQLRFRSQFYNTDHPERITFGKMVSIYKELSRKDGFDLEWYFYKRRKVAYYLVLKLHKFDFQSM